MIEFLAGLLRRIRGKDAVVGGIYLTDQFDGTFGVAKVLVADRGGVHARLYGNVYDSPPETIDPVTLQYGAADGEPVGVGHVPLTWRQWHAWNPAHVSTTPVKDDELEGYGYWLDAEGGYFDLDDPL